MCIANLLVSELLRPSEHTDCNSTDVQRLLSFKLPYKKGSNMIIQGLGML